MPDAQPMGRTTPVDLPPLLRRRLIIVAALVAVASGFFSGFRALQPAELAYFTASAGGRLMLGAEVALCGVALGIAFALWRWPHWWTLRRLRAVEYVLVGGLAGYIGWTQLFAFAGERVAPHAASEPYLIRLVTESLAIRWAVAIVGMSTLIPETLRRNALIVGAQVLIALTLTTVLATTDPVYASRAPFMIGLMALWLALAGTIAIFGAAKLQELRREVAEARRLGQYQLVRRIGIGGMGEVHLAEHLLLKQPVAVKLIRPERAGDPGALTRFEREVRATAQLTHWNTVRIYDYGFTADGTFYYVMEYLDGLTLDQLVQQFGPLPPARAIHILRQVCAALREAHRMQLVHRDVKPANIMLCQRGGEHDVAKLLDFGLVRGAGPTVETTLASHHVLGTPGYMSPEQAQGREPLDARTDIYALGATAYLMLTGVPAIARGQAVQMLIAQATTPVQPLRRHVPELPVDLEAVVLRCLELEPARRFASAAHLDEALAACADAGGWLPEDGERWWRTHPLVDRGESVVSAEAVTAAP